MPDAKSGFVDRIEETLISLILGLMTLITFANVVARYVFNLNILWALELTVFMFAWLVLLGASYAVKKSAHLGVDAVINIVGPRVRLVLGMIAAALCVLYALLMLKGGWDYWANFANLPQTEGRWFPLGFESDYLSKGWYEVNDIPMPAILRWIEPLMNEGEHYEKIPRFIPYAVLPLSMALLLFRFIQATVRLLTGRIDRLVASHEAEDDITDIRGRGGETG